MLWTTPLFDALYAKALQVWKGLRPNASVAPGSDVDLLATTVVNSELRNNRFLRLVAGWLFPWTASGKSLSDWLWFSGCEDGSGGYGRILARGSSGVDVLAVEATAACTLNSGEELTYAGLRYQVAETHVFGIESIYPHTVELDCAAISTGTATNLPTGAVLEWASPPANISASPVLVGPLTGGVDDELDPPGRARVLDRWQRPSLSGNNVQWRRWIEQTYPGALRGYVWPRRQNDGRWGTVDYGEVLIDEIGDASELSATQRAAVEASIVANGPQAERIQTRHVAVDHEALDVSCAITLHPAADADKMSDFDAKTLNATVSTYSEANKTITANKDITAYIAAGDRVIIGSAQAVVVHVGIAGGLAADTMLEVETWFETYDEELNPYNWTSTYIPTGDQVLSGRGLILECIGALRDYFRGLGPSRGSYAASDDEDWDDTYRYKLAMAAVCGVDQVIIDAALVAETDTAPTATTTATAYRLKPGELIVWEDRTP